MSEQISQQVVCERYQAPFLDSPSNLKVGISQSVRDKIRPIHGLRLEPEADTTGWYIWSGEYSEDDSLFIPLHVSHVADWEPHLQKYLGLAPGWRFLVNPEEDYEDVWYDPNLLFTANK
jgi:hypothetical protein